ncbi:MAG: DUF4450 domain-containing protein [Chitinophagaceae bacterium]|nr:DUF4450 domain-containing protein [Chitinophagaceae bacterium]
MLMRSLFFVIVLCSIACLSYTQKADTAAWWHGKERTVHYLPDGKDFVCVQPTLRFNRALYGTHTAFRAEAGDLPEFAMYMPGMGGNLRFALMKADQRKWLIKAQKIKTIYRAGSMLYEIEDELLGNGKLFISVLALSNAEGMVLRISSENIPGDVQLVWVYGGASGKKFSRDGDIGADPESSFYLKAENCADNLYQLLNGKFILTYGTGKVLTEEERYEIQSKPESQLAGEIPKDAKRITGFYPQGSSARLMDASDLEKAFNSGDTAKRNFCITGKLLLKNTEEYFLLYNTSTPVSKSPGEEFNDAESARQKLVERIQIKTPDKYLNTLGGALSVAADAIWEEPTYMHGAIAWRMRLPGWRGAYMADPLGWHDRARTHFDAYAKSQLTTPATSGVVMDTALNLARHIEKVGTQLFSDGYITRNPNGYVGAHHYDMNLGFIDQLINHFNYTGDTAYAKRMWPLLKRHLAWEKKNFDADGDGLYDAYAAIWASDAMQYSGGGVTHSSAYNYRAFKEAARLAKLVGEDGSMYEKEAGKILNAIHKNLWMADKGWYAEYKDLLGNKLLHPAAGLWTIYHAIDSKVPDAFKAYQSLRYIDQHIPHIPVKAKGWEEKDLYLLSETNWQPYTWSLNNVVFAENLHTALAYWQGNRSEEAFKLWRSTILETMYLSSGPGNFQQLSFYDAIRGELYRDFADGLGMTARTLVEGLFGIQPDALNKRLIIQPGFPSVWNNATIQTPDIRFDFARTGDKEVYTIKQNTYRHLDLQLIIPAQKDNVAEVLVNGKPVKWKALPNRVGNPAIGINVPASEHYTIVVKWKGDQVSRLIYRKQLYHFESFAVSSKLLSGFELYDPQKVLIKVRRGTNSLAAKINQKGGHKTFFIKAKQGAFSWWQPVDIYITKTHPAVKVKQTTSLTHFEKIGLASSFNDGVANIFRNKYLSPRPTSPTLQLPVHGIGNWAYHSVQVNISDSGLRAAAGIRNEFITSTGIPFQTPGDTGSGNIVFTSMWDNYPDSVIIPLTGNSSHAYFLMAGSTNPMQSRMINGEIIVNYVDGSSSKLELKNPENWWPIEQDYYTDGYAFTTDAPRPIRIALKTGNEISKDYKYSSIRGFSNFGIDGGAATVLDMPLDITKPLKNLIVRTIANDVVIGLMATTLVR